MSLTALRPLPAFLAVCVLLALAVPAYARGDTHAHAPRRSAPFSTAERSELFAPRVRRSTVMYLRLRLLELREAGLERARAAIERRLSIDDLLAEPSRPPSIDGKNRHPRPPQPPLPSQR